MRTNTMKMWNKLSELLFYCKNRGSRADWRVMPSLIARENLSKLLLWDSRFYERIKIKGVAALTKGDCPVRCVRAFSQALGLRIQKIPIGQKLSIPLIVLFPDILYETILSSRVALNHKVQDSIN